MRMVHLAGGKRPSRIRWHTKRNNGSRAVIMKP
jgi:hypothetical protein